MRERLYSFIRTFLETMAPMNALFRMLGVSLALIIVCLALSPMVRAQSAEGYIPMPPGDFSIYRGDNYDIYYDPTAISDVSDAIAGTDQAYDKINQFFGKYAYRTKIILAASHAQYAAIQNKDNLSEADVAGSWGDADRGTIVIEAPRALPDFNNILSNELANIAMRTSLIGNKYNMPDWFSAGMAGYISGGVSSNDRTQVEELCKQSKLMTVDQMNDLIHRADTGQDVSSSEASLARAQSAMLIEYVANTYGNDSIKLIMTDFAPTGDLSKAFQKRTGYVPEELNANWGRVFKSALDLRDGVVLNQRISGYVIDDQGQPLSNLSVVFTPARNDSTALKPYSAMTSASGYYQLNLTYGPMIVRLDDPGYGAYNNTIVLQNDEVRLLNITLNASKAVGTKQASLTAGGMDGNLVVYALLAFVNVIAIGLLIAVFRRVKR